MKEKESVKGREQKESEMRKNGKTKRESEI